MEYATYRLYADTAPRIAWSKAVNFESNPSRLYRRNIINRPPAKRSIETGPSAAQPACPLKDVTTGAPHEWGLRICVNTEPSTRNPAGKKIRSHAPLTD